MYKLNDPPMQGDERPMLRDFLDLYRAILWRKAQGLTEEQSRVTVAPSNLSMIGLIRHMALVEQIWFSRTFLGNQDEEILWNDPTNYDRDFEPRPEDTLAEALHAYDREVTRARQIEQDAASLDVLSAIGNRDRIPSLRWIIIHMIEEYARHCGHADLIRQSIDGATGD
jgi:uncharacterized damage-inducible protein DinB